MSGSSGNPRDSLLLSIPPTLRQELFEKYDEIITHYLERKWEPSELNGGKFCEVVYTILKGYCDDVYSPSAIKPANMVDACRAFEQSCPPSTPRSVRIQIPRMLIALYEIRNNRGVGHVGGDVDPNQMDATCVLHISQWILAELIRIYHSIKTEEALIIVGSLTERIIPLVWDVASRKRVLRSGLTMKEKTLLLLYSEENPVIDRALFEWVEHSNLPNYRRDVLRRLHFDKLVEYDEKSHLVYLSPLGENEVEKKLLNI
jgi:hypothetical protein